MLDNPYDQDLEEDDESIPVIALVVVAVLGLFLLWGFKELAFT